MQNYTYTNPNNEQMDISIFSYFSTFTLGLMCYSFFNPGVFYDMSMFLAYTFAKTMITGNDIYSKYIYRPYIKHVRRPMMNFLNIDDGLYEIEIVKDGNVIYRFKTMADFIKNNPIKFICEDEDESESESGSESESESKSVSSSGSESESCSETEQPSQPSQPSQPQQLSELETPIDADLTNENVNIHETDTISEVQDSEVVDDEDDTDEPDNIILEPSEYDFVLRTMYFEDDSINVPFGFCLKYETFRKSDMKQKYSYEQLKNSLSKRKFIGIHIKTEGMDYIINLTNPVNYYIVDNTILDYSFLKMYLFKRYSVILGNNYTLSCIDNFIEMYTIKEGKKVFIKKNSFKIVDDETYNIAEDTESSIIPNTSSEPETIIETETCEIANDTDIEIVEYS